MLLMDVLHHNSGVGKDPKNYEWLVDNGHRSESSPTNEQRRGMNIPSTVILRHKHGYLAYHQWWGFYHLFLLAIRHLIKQPRTTTDLTSQDCLYRPIFAWRILLGAQGVHPWCKMIQKTFFCWCKLRFLVFKARLVKIWWFYPYVSLIEVTGRQ